VAYEYISAMISNECSQSSTYNHDVESHQDQPFYPVGLGVGSDSIHHEARPKQQTDFKYVEEKMQRLADGPCNHNKNREPEKEKLDARIDRASLGQLLRSLGCAQEVLERVSDKVHGCDCECKISELLIRCV
jgi:hypothetical protein